MKSINRDEFKALLRSAGVKSRIISELRFVPEEINDWQYRDFLAVTNRSKSAGVLIYPDTETVPMFTLQRRSTNASGGIEPIICDICATWRRGTESVIITFQRTNSSVSYLCCDDLLCSLHVRDRTNAATLSRTQLRENISVQGRVDRLHDRMKNIVKAG